jgi:ABC-type antimicrobial peptide transport system permease subunit
MTVQALARLVFCAIMTGEIGSYLPDTPWGWILRGVVFWLTFYPAVRKMPAVSTGRWTSFLSKYWIGMVSFALIGLGNWALGVAVPKNYIAAGVGVIFCVSLVMIVYQRLRKRPA